ncbi:MAG TPA: S8 family serine peptidase [Gaiellaceae bacterium]|nr:S8 family serine peptidase [Gaiellaceae bacterium]
MSAHRARMLGLVLGVVVLALTVVVSVAGAGARPAGQAPAPAELLPDLEQELPSDLTVTRSGPATAPRYSLGFRSAVRNVGNGPLVIRGHRDDGQTPTMTADQAIERSDGSESLVPGIGSMRYVVNPDHQHWHYLGFDRYQIYELRRARASTAVERDHKTGFCLGDRYEVTTAPVPNRAPKPSWLGRCGLGDPSLLSIEEGISVGYGDSYAAFLEGQDLPLDGLSDGRYVLVHRVNTDRKIRELSYANDAASILLDLRWHGGVPNLRVVLMCPDSATCDDPPAKPKAAVHRRARSKPAARASGSFVPDDSADGTAGGWAALQWNFAGPNGVDAPRAWANANAAGAPGGAGVTIAVLDTGVAYADLGPYGASPDMAATTFVPGWDFVDDDPDPIDENGHGTHVAATIAEATNNGYGLTGLAYGARIMPVRVLDASGNGDATTIARGIMFAVDHGAKVINLSLNFTPDVDSSRIGPLLSALAYAKQHGSLVVAAAGNEAAGAVDYPARSNDVLAVGATTEFGCAAQYSNFGPDLDVVAPGGGADAPLPGDPYCEDGRVGRPIYQVGFEHRPDQFGISNPYIGTSMAAPEVTATAALVIAAGVLGPNPTPAQLIARIERTARDLGPTGYDEHYGWGLVDAGAATAAIRLQRVRRAG